MKMSNHTITDSFKQVKCVRQTKDVKEAGNVKEIIDLIQRDIFLVAL